MRVALPQSSQQSMQKKPFLTTPFLSRSTSLLLITSLFLLDLSITASFASLPFLRTNTFAKFKLKSKLSFIPSSSITDSSNNLFDHSNSEISSNFKEVMTQLSSSSAAAAAYNQYVSASVDIASADFHEGKQLLTVVRSVRDVICLTLKFENAKHKICCPYKSQIWRKCWF